MSTHIHKSTCHIVRLLMMLCAQMTHCPPLTTLELCDSDPRIDLDGLFSLVDFSLLLVASPGINSCSSALCNHCHTHSLPIHHQHRCTHARVTKQLFAGLDQESCGYSRPEILIDGELHLVGMPSSSSIALITIKQATDNAASGTISSKQRSNKSRSLYVALISSIVDVILVYSCTKLTWMYACAADMRIYLSLSLLQHPVCCYYSPALFILVLILMVCAYYSIVNPPASITSSCI